MTTTYVGILIIAIAIFIDRKTMFRHDALPPIAFVGVLTVIASIVL